MVDKLALDKAHSAVLLKSLKKDQTLHFWFNPKGKGDKPVLLVEKDESRLNPKRKREKANSKAKEKSFEGTVALDSKGKVVFDGDGGSTLKQVKEGIKKLGTDDSDYKAAKSRMTKPVIVSGDEREEDEDTGTEVTETSKTESDGKARWLARSKQVQGEYQDAKSKLGGESTVFKTLKDLKDRAFETKKKGDLEAAIKLLDELSSAIAKSVSVTTETMTDEEWKQLREMSQEVYTTASRILPKSHTDWGELDDLRKKAVAAKRKGDLGGSAGFLRNLIDKAQNIIRGSSDGPSLDDWNAAMVKAREAFAKLDAVSGAGDPHYDIIDSKRRAGVELKKRGDLGASITLFGELVFNIHKVLKDLEAIDPEQGVIDWEQLAADFKLARRRKKHSWFWFCREGADGNPALFIERKEETMRVRGKAALRTAAKKKNLSGFITRGEDGSIIFWGEGGVTLEQADKDVRTKLAKLDALSAVAPQLRAIVWKKAADADERPVDEVGDEDELLDEPVSFVGLQKARLQWDQARRELRAQVNKIQEGMVKAFPGEQETADKLERILTRYDDTLLDQLDAALNASGDARVAEHRKARKTLETYLGLVKNDELLKHIDRARFVKVETFKTVSGALEKIGQQIGL